MFPVCCEDPTFILGAVKIFRSILADQTDMPFISNNKMCFFPFLRKHQAWHLPQSLSNEIFAMYFTGMLLCLSTFKKQLYCMPPLVFEFTNLTNKTVACNVSWRRLCDDKVSQYTKRTVFPDFEVGEEVCTIMCGPHEDKIPNRFSPKIF